MTTKHLRATIAEDGGPIQLSTRGSVATFSNEFVDGSAFLVHRPHPNSSCQFAHEHRLTEHGARYCFEIQMQFRFKVAPRGPLFLTGELRDGPMKLNLVTRALCRVLLGAIKQQASKRGTEFRYSFGDKQANPSITIPLFAVDRMILSDNPVDLPVNTDEDKGTWRWQDGRLSPVERSTVCLEAGSCATFMMATSYLDFESWCVSNIPGVGNLDLTQFWGQQPLHAVIFDESSATSGYPSSGNRTFFDLELRSIAGDAMPSPVKAPKASPTFDFRTSTGEEEIKDREFELHDAAVEGAEVDEDSPGDGDEEITRRLSHYTDDDGQDNQESSDENENGDDRKPGEDEDWEVQSQSTISNKSVKLMDGLNARRQFQPQELQGPIESDVADGIKARLVSIPWYFCNGAGETWWCIEFNGVACWRPHSHLQQLCNALGGEELNDLGLDSSLQNFELARRTAARLLTQGSTAPGLLEEFTQMGVSLEGLLSGAIRPKNKAMFLGVVEAEGRIIERYVWANGQTLRWCVRRSRHRRAKVHNNIDLKLATLNRINVAGAEALKLSTPHKGHVLIAKDGSHLRILEESLTSLQTNGVLGMSMENAPSVDSDPEKNVRASTSLFASLPSTVGRALAEAAASVPAVWMKGKMAAVQETATKKLQRPRPPWKDLLRRWPANRIIVNDSDLYLSAPPADPVAFSAELLRLAVAAQGNLSLVHAVTLHSCALKRVDLTGLREQDLWSFWVNVYHSLLVHAQLVAGRPSNVQQIFGFYSSCSYLVAGHPFSLLEIEHSVLRHSMTKPKIVLVGTILRSWPRSDEDLETRPCLAAPVCAATCFACRADWRLNLVLNAGNIACADTLPVFESMDEAAFNRRVQKAMDQTLASCGCVARDVVELPYNLSRYRDDAPAGTSRESSERRWLNVLFPELVERVDKVIYKRGYGWTMRKHLKLDESVDKTEPPLTLVEI